MKFNFNEDETLLKEMEQEYEDLGQDAIFYTHYELAQMTDYDADEWRMFLSDARVASVLDAELNLLQQASIRKMTRNIEDNKSTGQAQLLNTLLTQAEKGKVKTEPVFIYSYIPLNEQEEHAPDVHVEESDPFVITTRDGQTYRGE